jgi:hypothetical protein
LGPLRHRRRRPSHSSWPSCDQSASTLQRPAANCLRAKCNGQLQRVVRASKTTCCARPAQLDCPKHSRLVGGQFPAKTSCQMSQIQGVFASIRLVRPVCPLRAAKMHPDWDNCPLSLLTKMETADSRRCPCLADREVRPAGKGASQFLAVRMNGGEHAPRVQRLMPAPSAPPRSFQRAMPRAVPTAGRGRKHAGRVLSTFRDCFWLQEIEMRPSFAGHDFVI